MEAESKATPLYSGQRVVRVTIKRLKRCQQSLKRCRQWNDTFILCDNISTALHAVKKMMRAKEPYTGLTDVSIRVDTCCDLSHCRGKAWLKASHCAHNPPP